MELVAARASQVPGQVRGSNAGTPQPRPGFSAVYEAYFHEVARWLRAFSVPEFELEDVAQEVFLVVQRKLDAFDGQNLAGWLYRIARNTASDYRRRAWFRKVFRRPRGAEPGDLPSTGSGPERILQQKESRERLFRLLGKLGDKHRSAFVLFEIEGYSGEEIGALEGIPVATVWTRLHHARKQFLKLLSKDLDREET